MFRYLALTWNESDAAATAAAQAVVERLDRVHCDWAAAIQRPGLQVRYTRSEADSSDVCYLSQGQGVVLGTLFRSLPGGRSTRCAKSLSDSETDKIVASRGHILVEEYWGRYVAFMYDAAARTARVLRDPSATLPCFSHTRDGVTIYFLEFADAVGLGLGPWLVNWDYLAATLCMTGGLQARETGVVGVTQILGGECEERHEDKVTRAFYWSPWAIAGEPIQDMREAAQPLHQCVTDVVHAWASCHSCVALALSGGLDSSILAVCLVSAPTRPRIVPFTYFSAGADSDERHYARLVAQRTNLSLLEVQRNPNWNLQELLEGMRLSPTPNNSMSFVESARVEPRIVRDANATAIVSGFGGDQLFCQNTAMAAGDFLVDQGPLRHLFRVALDDARMSEASVWGTVFAAVAQRLTGRRWNPISYIGRHRTLLPREVIEAARQQERFLHPLMQRPLPKIGSGKIFQANQLLHPPVIRNPLGAVDDPEHVAPLFSQPLINLCLRIPTYVHAKGGRDRVVARRAFRDELPMEVSNRWTKGGWDDQATSLYRGNVTYLRHLLMDGELVRQGLLERRSLEQCLSLRPTRLRTSLVEIYDFIFVEAWLRGIDRLKLRTTDEQLPNNAAFASRADEVVL